MASYSGRLQLLVRFFNSYFSSALFKHIRDRPDAPQTFVFAGYHSWQNWTN